MPTASKRFKLHVAMSNADQLSWHDMCIQTIHVCITGIISTCTCTCIHVRSNWKLYRLTHKEIINLQCESSSIFMSWCLYTYQVLFIVLELHVLAQLPPTHVLFITLTMFIDSSSLFHPSLYLTSLYKSKHSSLSHDEALQ